MVTSIVYSAEVNIRNCLNLGTIESMNQLLQVYIIFNMLELLLQHVFQHRKHIITFQLILMIKYKPLECDVTYTTVVANFPKVICNPLYPCVNVTSHLNYPGPCIICMITNIRMVKSYKEMTGMSL